MATRASILPAYALLALVLDPAFARSDEPRLEEQLVSSAGGTTPVLGTPGGISIFDTGTLQVFGIDSAEDLGIRTPSLNITPGDINLRGVGGSGEAFIQDPGVAVYNDGVYSPVGRVFDYTNLFDVQRIEVLRGPQGTTYGRNAIGGAVNLLSIAPSMTWQSKVLVEGGNYDYRVLQGLMSGPITDQLSMVVSGSTIEHSEIQEDPLTGEGFDDRDTQYLRASFKYHWNNLWYSRVQISAANDESNLHTDVTPGEEMEQLSGYLLNELALGDLRLKHLASYSDTDLDRQAAVTSYGLPDTRIDEDSTSHDLQIYSSFNGSLNFVSGLYYYRATREQDLQQSLQKKLEIKSVAAYGQANWDWTERLRFSVGLRYSHDDKENLEAEEEWDNFDWRLALDYQMPLGQMVYASLATGYRSGSIEGLEPEDLLAAEIGYKASLLDNRLHLTSAAYFYDYKDVQPKLPGTNKSGSADAWGTEVEVKGLVGKRLTVGGAWSYNSADYSKPDTIHSNTLPFTSDHQLNLYTTLNWSIQQVNLDLTIDYMYAGEQYTSALNAEELGSFDRWDSRLTLGWGVWSLTAYVKNITDESSEILWHQPDAALPPYPTGMTAPRTYGLRLVYQL